MALSALDHDTVGKLGYSELRETPIAAIANVTSYHPYHPYHTLLRDTITTIPPVPSVLQRERILRRKTPSNMISIQYQCQLLITHHLNRYDAFAVQLVRPGCADFLQFA